MSHFALLLWAGDYRDASKRWEQGLPDRYRHHGYALESLQELRRRGHDVTVIQARSDMPYDEDRLNGIRMVGLTAFGVAQTAAAIGDLLRGSAATHVMLRFPAPAVLEELTRVPARKALVLADSFPIRLRSRKRYLRLQTLFADPAIDFIGNHQLNSSRQLVRRLRVDPERVIPWDWPLDLVAEAAQNAGSTLPPGPVRLCYVGSINRLKGVWDLVDAVAVLRRGGVPASLELAGAGDVEGLEHHVAARGLTDQVTLLGRIGGDDVIDLMRRATFVCVPSRHAYPEGLPLTLYEAMASGTPVVASDHRMFRGVVRDRQTGFVFRAGSARHLANTVLRAWRDPDLYARVSRAAAHAYPEMGLDTLWGDLVLRWSEGGEQDRAWLRSRTLAARDRANLSAD